MLIYAAPLGVAGGIWWLFRLRPRRRQFQFLGVFCLAALMVAGPHFLRNCAVFGSPLGSRFIVSIET